MKKLLNMGVLLALILGMVGYALPAYASTPQSYSVLVGAENTSKGISIGSFFPQSFSIHVGDSVTWTVNTHEIHTVTFLAGNPKPVLILPAPPGMPSPLQLNPLVAFPVLPQGNLYDGTTYLNSGVMSTDPGGFRTLTLTFTHEGVFPYYCVIHGQTMTGSITVVGADQPTPTPAQVQAQGMAELKAAWLKVPGVFAKANGQIVPPVRNPDGTFTHTIILGYMSDNIMIMSFFPKRDTVHQGDTVVWKLSDMNDAPHTVTFYNGAPDLSFVIIAQGPNGPVALINPAVLFPSAAVMQGIPLNGTDFFNSGLLTPGPNSTFTLKVGDVSGLLDYECILHDTSGMTGSLFIVPRPGLSTTTH